MKNHKPKSGIFKRYRKLTTSNKIALWGVIVASIGAIAAIFAIFAGSNNLENGGNRTSGNKSPIIEDVKGDVKIDY